MLPCMVQRLEEYSFPVPLENALLFAIPAPLQSVKDAGNTVWNI